jgi:hemolysin activation/secretion protein
MRGYAKEKGIGCCARHVCLRLAASTALVSNPVAAAAQNASQVLPPTREEVTRPALTPPPPASPRVEIQGGFQRAPCALDGPQFASIRFTLRAAEFEGLKGVSQAELTSAYAPWIGHEVPISVVCDIRDRAASILESQGYIAAIQVPEQRIDGGVVHFSVLMAHLAQVRVRGDASGAERLIAAYLNHLTSQPVFNRFVAERYLLLATDVPGYTVRLTLRPAGTTPGEVVGDVTVERTRAYADFNLQNGGSHAIGPWGGLLHGEVYGITGLGDRTTLTVFSTPDFREQQTVQLGHDMRLGANGLTLSGSFTYGWARPTVPDARVLARTLLGTVELGYPFLRGQTENLRGSVGMDVINQTVLVNGDPFSRDRLRVMFARIGFDAISKRTDLPGYSVAEPPWRFTSLFEVRQGLHGLGATRNCGFTGLDCVPSPAVPPARPGGESNATVLRYTASGEFRPVPRLTFALTARAQDASAPVMSFEEFAAGNYTAGRGYDPGSLLGDSGVGTQTEIRYGSRVPISADKAAIEGYAFWDSAFVRAHRGLAIVDGSRHLNSVGAGARLNFDRFSFDAALAVPLTRIGANNRRPGASLLVSLTTRLWPWQY